MASLISFHCVCQKVQGWETLSLFHCSSMAAGRGGGDDHLLSTVAETRHELVSVSFLHIYKASNVCVPLWKERGHQDLSLCQATCRLQKKAGELAFFPPRDFVVSSPRGRPFRPALDQFRYYRVERKLATHPNVLTTSFRYGDKSSGVDTTQGRRNRWCRG